MAKELLFSLTKKDFEIQTFRCSGPGGQNVNKVNSGVRIIHRESGAVGESTRERQQGQNKKIAFRKLIESQEFKLWMNKKIFEVTHDLREIKNKVNRQMDEDNLKIEIIQDGKWTEIEKENKNV